MARRRRSRRMPAALRRYWASRRRGRGRARYSRRRTRRVRRHSFRVSGYHRLRGRVRVRRRTFTLARRSRFKRALRGYRMNPYVAEYLMNPRRRRRSGRRHHYRHNPATGALRAVTSTFEMGTIKTGAVAAGGTLLTIAVGNTLLTYLAPYVPSAIQTGYLGIAAKAAVRSVVAFGLDQYVVGHVVRDRNAFRVGAAIGIIGSAILEALGKSLIVGAGDSGQSLSTFVPAGIPGLSSYSRGGRIAMNSYSRGGRIAMSGVRGGMGALNVGTGVQLGNEAHQRLYGYGS